MRKRRISRIKASLKQLGEIQVNDWDIRGLLSKDIKDLEIGSSPRRLGSRRVIEWDYRTVVPALHKLARQEVDVVGWVKRTANIKVIAWDYRTVLGGGQRVIAAEEREELRAINELISRLRGFLEFIVVNLIGDAERAKVTVEETAAGVVRFRLVVAAGDLKELLGRHGATAAALRNIVKGCAAAKGHYVLLEIISIEDEQARRVKLAKVNGPRRDARSG